VIDPMASCRAFAGEEIEALDPLEIARCQFRLARAHLTRFEEGLIEFFEAPKKVNCGFFPAEMDDSSPRTIHASRVCTTE